MIRCSILVVSALALVSGCSSKKLCSKACNRIAECQGVDQETLSCPFTATCGQVERCKAQCVLDSPCSALLGQQGSEVLLLCQNKCDQGTAISDGSASDGTPIKTDSSPGSDGAGDQLVVSDTAPLPDGSLPMDAAPTMDVSGSWQGTWTSTIFPAQGSCSAQLSQSGTTITGNFTLSNSALPQGPYPMQGQLVGGSVDWSFDAGIGIFEVKTQLNSGMNKLTGTYLIKVDGSTYDTGTVAMGKL